MSETNRYHNQQVAAEQSRHRGSGVLLLGRKWRHLYFGILIYMGIVKLPRMHMYSTQTRFLYIWRHFHLTDNSNAPPREDSGFVKIYRVRQFLGFVLRNSQILYRLDREVSIDESMVPPKGAFHSSSTLRTNR